MTDFPIRVVIKPDKAISGTKAVKEQLSSLESSAKKLQKTLNETFQDVKLNQLRRDLTNTTVRLRGVTTQSAKLRRTLTDLNRQPLSRLQRGINATRAGFQRLGRTASSALRDIKRRASEAKIEVGGLGSVIAAVGAAAGIRAIINTGRSFQNLQRRILSVSDGALEAEANLQLIKTVSEETGTALETNAALFQRLTVATRRLGLTANRTVGVIRTLNQAMVLGGASAQEARSALTQLGQGLASNRLQGDELRSLLENAPLLAEKLSQQLGITVGELREMGAAGELTGDKLIAALEGAAGDIDQAFKTLGPSLDQTLQRLENSVLELGPALQPFIRNLSDSLTFMTKLVKEAGDLINLFRDAPGASGAAARGAAGQTFIDQITRRTIGGLGVGVTAPPPERPEFLAQAGQRSSQEVFDFESQKLANQLGVFDRTVENLGPQLDTFRRKLMEAGVSASDLSSAVVALDSVGGNLASTQQFISKQLGLTAESLDAVKKGSTTLVQDINNLITGYTNLGTQVVNSFNAQVAAIRKLERATKGQVQTLKDQSRLIGVEGAEREALTQRIRAEASIRRKKLDLNSAEAKTQLDLIEKLALDNAQRRENVKLQKQQVKSIRDVKTANDSQIQALQTQSRLIGLEAVERAGLAARIQAETTLRSKNADVTSAESQSQLDLIESLARENAERERGIALREEVQQARDDRQIEIANVETFTSRLMDANTAAQQLSLTFADTLVGGINASADALADFAVNGARDFNALKEQLSNIFKDISKQILAAIIKALILRAISGIVGGGGGTDVTTLSAGGIAGLAATGSSTAHSKRSYTVNEGGRELFVSQSSNLAGWAAGRRASKRTHSSRTRLGGRQAGGAVIPGGGALTGFTPPSAGQIIPAADTARLLNQERRGNQPTIIQAPAPKVEVSVTPQIVVGEKVFEAVIKNSDVVQTAIATTVQKNQAGIRQAGSR